MSSLTMSACENFVENVWSKGKCSNCFKSLTSHRLSDERTRKSDKCFDTGANGIAKGQEYHTSSNRRVARSNGLTLKEREHAAKGGNLNRTKLATRTKPTLSTSDSTIQQERGPVERNKSVKPALSPKPKPVPKPRQRTSSALLVCDQSGEFCSRQASPNVESERSTEFPGDSKDRKSEPGGSKFNTSEIKTEGDTKLDIPSSTKTGRNGESETAENQSILDKEQKTCTVVSSSETNSLGSACADSSQRGETQCEEGEEEYVPMKNNVFDMNTIVGNYGADVLDPDRDKTHMRSISETSITSSDSVFDSEEDSKGIQNGSSVDIDRNSSALTSALQKQVKRSNDMNGEGTKNSDKLSTNPNDTKQVSDNEMSSNVRETGPRPSLKSLKTDLSPEVGQANAQNLSILSDAESCSSWDSKAWESSSDVQEAESMSSRQRGLGELKITGTVHDPFGSKAVRRQSNPDIKEQILEGPVYINSNVKPSTKPYKVVDVSTGMLVTDDHSQTPPLPPKAKDLVLDSVPHEYMEPTEGPYKGVPTGGPDKGPMGRPYSAFNPSDGRIVTSSISEPTDLLRHGTQVSSQCGTLPKAVSRASRVLTHREEKSHTEDGTDSTQTATVDTSCNISTPTETSTPTQAAPPPGLPSQVASGKTTASASQNASGLSGDASNMVPRPKRSAPTRPNYSPPLLSSHRESVVSLSSTTSPLSSNQAQAAQQIVPTTTKSSSPKSAIKKAFTSMKRIGSKKRSKRRTLEISGPILVNEEIPSFAAQQEAVRKRALSEGNVLQVVRHKSAQDNFQMAVPNPESPPTPPVDKHSEQTMSPPLPARRRQGYENYPFSQTGDTIERPQKPPRKPRVVNPLRDTSVHSIGTKENQIEEPAYLEPCEDELTFKVEAALANLNDAAILAEALSRVEQEKLGPLPAVPKSRHVRFQIASADTSQMSTTAGSKPAMPNRPVSAVLSTPVDRVSDSSSGDPPELPSRPPNSKLSKKQLNHFGRSQSVKEVRNSDSYAVKVARSQSLSGHANVLERRYNKILKLQMQTLGEVVESRKASLLPANGLNWSDTRWRDYEVWSPALKFELPGAVFLPVKCFQIPGGHKLLAKVHTQPVLSVDMQINQEQVALKNDLQFCESLPHHVNTARVLTHFNSNVAGDIIKQWGCGACEATIAITDQVPVETVARFVERTVGEHESSPEGYERKVCFLMLQILSGLAHLAREGVLHCDLTLENLLLLEQEHLVISNFASACRESDICSDSDLDRKINCSPPELVLPAKSGAPLDYKKCDCFAVGCMIYKLLHRKNPFAANVALVRQDYSIADLPSMCKKSRYSQGLGTVACHLLHRDPATRMSASESLQLLQVLLWGPDSLDEECLESAAGDWLETERAHMVAKIARSQMQCDPSTKGYLETFLKCQFLFDATEESLVKCCTLLQNV